MAGRSWFYASEGQQQGPYPEIQLREFIARGTITADTLVWTEGMANWQRAADVPGLITGASGPPVIPLSSGALPSAGGHAGGALSIDLPLWGFLGRALLYIFGITLVIPRRGPAPTSTAGRCPALMCRGGPIWPSPARSAISGGRSS